MHYHFVLEINLSIIINILFQKFASQLALDIKGHGYDVEVIDLKTYEPEDNLSEEVGEFNQS